MTRKTVRFNKSGINQLPENKPIVYKITSKGGGANYIGIATRGRVQERLTEHLPGGPDAIPGAKVVIQQMDNIIAARAKMEQLIKRQRPKYNMQGK